MTDEIIAQVLQAVLEKIRPSEQDRTRLCKVYDYVKSRLEKCLSRVLSLEDIEISIQGSLAKDTFLRSQSDIDVFVLFKPSRGLTTDWFKSTLIPTIIDCFNSYKYTLNYASHPYITLIIEDVEVNLVPAFKVKSPSSIISAVDRTPFHTEYVRRRLSEVQKDEVRALKQFLKAWKLYGAEIEIQGFSGYLTELLVIAYGSFYNLLKNVTNWRAYKTCIDIERHYTSSKECLEKFKGSVLVVVDPVDARRNVAAALSLKKFSMFKLLARLFLEKPSIEFFFDESVEDLDKTAVESYIDQRLRTFDSCLYIVLFDVTKPVPDVIWGQLHRLKFAVINTLRSHSIDQEVYADVWVNNSLTRALLVVEIMRCSKLFKLHKGPYAYDTVNAIKFLVKNRDSDVGPWIGDDGRLYTIKFLSQEDVIESITKVIMSMSLAGLRFSKLITITRSNDLQLLSQDNIDQDFRYWLKKFLERKLFKKFLLI